METVEFTVVDEILAAHDNNKTNTVAILQDIQAHYGYLPKDVLCYAAKQLGISEAKIYGVATFYGNFSLFAKGKYVIKVCRGTACHVRRSDKVLEAIYEATGLSEDKPVTDDGIISIETVSCLGACGLSPVVMVNEEVHPQMTTEKVKELIADLKAREANA